MPGRAALLLIAALLVGVLGAGAYMMRGRPAPPPPAAPLSAGAGTAATKAPQAPTPGRRITAHLYYVSDDGLRLVRVEHDVPFAEGADQAREIVEAQIAPPADPLVSAIPAGTSLRALFVTDRGQAFIDFSHQLISGHTGGSVDELLTVYTIVDAVTTNLPSIKAVQILVDGQPVPTLAGHVDLRRPLAPNLALVQ